MSDSSGSLNVPPRVLTTIGARDLYQLGTRKSGFLRKQGNIERRLSQLGKVAEQFKWRQKFVIVAKGCIYVYDNEDSTSPKTAFSLLGYNRILRFETSKTFAKNAFRIEMPLTESVRYRTFSAHSDEERKKKIFSPGDYEFDSTDTASAISYLKGQPKGTFLVLMVVDDKEEIKQYKIHQIESKFTLDQKMMFLSISEVMEYYRTCNVPNTTTKLTEGYGYK
ncbi:hypothetical protein KUTeg_022696 [Tegillarca granosa]|uniref:PH domain-containing protein n=1 Tax=Tegillarca granosa TaxID=220873 RepID=A0ABQ9E2K3_TEGGR|nr:hypothetical protein KUTeg_022696 [Tegillarca granosa]